MVDDTIDRYLYGRAYLRSSVQPATKASQNQVLHTHHSRFILEDRVVEKCQTFLQDTHTLP
jgi:hypothetical protein